MADLFAVADRDLQDCQTPALGADWQFNIGYNGALQLASAALAAAGYRAERANRHYRVIHSLEFTIGADAALIRKFRLVPQEAQYFRLRESAYNLGTRGGRDEGTHGSSAKASRGLASHKPSTAHSLTT
jgi:hypothetical protein